MKRRSSTLGAEALFASAFLYAFTGVLVREVSPMWGNDAQVAARMLLAFGFISAFLYFKKSAVPIPPKIRPTMIAWGLVYALIVLFFTASLSYTTLANVLFVYYATTLIVSFVLGTFVLGESVDLFKLSSLALAFAGLSVYTHALLTKDWGILLATFAGTCSGISNLFNKQLSNFDRLTSLRASHGIAGLFALAITLVSGEPIIRHVSLHASLLTLVFALVIITASGLLLYGFKHFDVNIAMIISSSEIVFGAVLGYLFFHEIPATHELVGGILVFIASIAASGIFERHKTEPIKIAQPD